jgi:hypothetical protein
MSIQPRIYIDPLISGYPLDRYRRNTENEDIWTITLPAGATASSTFEANNSLTLRITTQDGQQFSWNSGEWIACKFIENGFKLMGRIGGPAASLLVGKLAASGCQYTFQAASQDGDS